MTGDAGAVGPGNADLIFINGYTDGESKGENYVINFIGPGTITVDKSGILNPIADGNDADPASYGDTLTTKVSYEDLWSRGILQANGLSGLDGGNFADFFNTSGSLGADDYTLISLINGLLSGDCNGDGVVDAADLACICGSPDSGTVQDVLAVTGLLAGDLDANGTVEFADFLVLSANFATAVDSYVHGDIDCSGMVEFADFLALSANFGQSSGGTAAAIPEPSGLVLSCLGLLALWSTCRRARG